MVSTGCNAPRGNFLDESSILSTSTSTTLFFLFFPCIFLGSPGGDRRKVVSGKHLQPFPKENSHFFLKKTSQGT